MLRQLLFIYLTIIPFLLIASEDVDKNELANTEGLPELDCLIEPHKIVEITAAAPGVVKSIMVDRGDIIKKGQLIARLESGVEKVNSELYKKRVEFSDRNFSRIDEVYKNKGTSYHLKDQAAFEKQQASLEYKRSLETLKLRKVISPFTGIVLERFIMPGEYTEYEKIVKIAQVNPLNIEVIAPLNMFKKTKIGMKAIILPEQPIGGKYQATVKIVDQVFDPASGTFGIRLELPNLKHKIPAGIKCKVYFLK